MYASLLLVAPLIVGNLWHAVMPFIGRRKTNFKNSISENALRSKGVLLTHRIVHLALSFCFIIYSLYLFSQGVVLVAVLLVAAALFDAIQVMTLSKRTNHTPMYFRDIHQIFAWLMSITYLIFSLAFAVYQQIPVPAIIGYMLFLVLLLLVSLYEKHSYFWFAQMIFFVVVSMVMAALAIAYNDVSIGKNWGEV